MFTNKIVVDSVNRGFLAKLITCCSDILKKIWHISELDFGYGNSVENCGS